MIFKECRDWVVALQDCFARGRLSRLELALARLGERHPAGRWEGAVDSGPGFETVRLRYFGSGDFDAFKKSASRVFGLPGDGRAAPPPSFPWLSLDWEVATDEPVSARLYGRPRGMSLGPGQAVGSPGSGRPALYNAKPFTKDLAKDKVLGRVFADFLGLCPVRELVSEWEIGDLGKLTPLERWSLRLEAPLPWPRFARMNLASPFAEQASELAYLLLNRRVTEVAFAGGSLRAYFGA